LLYAYRKYRESRGTKMNTEKIIIITDIITEDVIEECLAEAIEK
jgi:hypothetical protein